MDVILQTAVVVVPCSAALGGLFVWGFRRMEHCFEEARLDRARIETQLEERFDRIEARCDRICLDVTCEPFPGGRRAVTG